MLEELGVEFSQEDYGGPFGTTQTAEYRQLNPNATVPILLDGSFSLWESNAILRYLAAKHQSGLYPTTLHGRANVDQWLDWKLGTLGLTFRPLYVEIVRNGKSVQQVEAHAHAARDLFAQLDRGLSRQTYFAGDALTLADIAIAQMVYRWYKLGLTQPDNGNLYRLLQCLEKRSGFAKHVMVELE